MNAEKAYLGGQAGTTFMLKVFAFIVWKFQKFKF